jgi:hypothetical protein
MKIIITPNEVVAALAAYVAAHGIDINTAELSSINEDGSVEVCISPSEVSDTPNDNDKPAPKKRVRRTKAQIEADEAAAKANKVVAPEENTEATPPTAPIPEAQSTAPESVDPFAAAVETSVRTVADELKDASADGVIKSDSTALPTPAANNEESLFGS